MNRKVYFTVGLLGSVVPMGDGFAIVRHGLRYRAGGVLRLNLLGVDRAGRITGCFASLFLDRIVFATSTSCGITPGGLSKFYRAIDITSATIDTIKLR